MPDYLIEKNIKPGIDRLVNVKDRCAVTIKRLGCEVIGYDVYDSAKNITLPLLWNNNNDFLPPDGGWKNHATVLFPVVGGLKDNRSMLGNTEITIPCGHGFARVSEFDLAEQKTDTCAQAVYRLASSETTRKYYPFDFVFDLIYTLESNRLSAKFRISNKDSKDIFLSFGWHPGFNTELGVGGKRSDWQIIFPEGIYRQYHVLIGEDSFLTGETSERNFKGPIKWTDDDLYYTLCYEPEKKGNRRCTLYNPVIKYGIKMDFFDFPFVGLWAKRGQEYICLEPWQGMDDHEQQEPFDKKVGIYRLAPGKTVEEEAVVTPLLGEKETF